MKEGSTRFATLYMKTILTFLCCLLLINLSAQNETVTELYVVMLYLIPTAGWKTRIVTAPENGWKQRMR